MSKHSRELREKAKQMWLSGKYASQHEIARQLGISPDTLGVWKRHDGWVEAQKLLQEKAVDRIADVYVQRAKQLTDEYWTVWRREFGILARLISERGEKLTLEEHEAISKILERAQKGQGIAMSVGAPDDEPIEREVVVKFRSLRESIAEARASGTLVRGGEDHGIRLVNADDGGNGTGADGAGDANDDDGS